MVQRNYKTITQQDSAIYRERERERALRCNIVIITSYDYLKSPSSCRASLSFIHINLYTCSIEKLYFCFRARYIT